MMKLFFFFIALSILIFSVIVVNISPCINKLVDINWPYLDCSYFSDSYQYATKKVLKDNTVEDIEKNVTFNQIKKEKTRCERRHIIYIMEYFAFNINIAIGLLCSLLGYLYYLNLRAIGKLIGQIGIGSGAIGFVLTVVYVIDSGLVFNDVASPSVIRVDSDGASLEWDKYLQRYTCIFFEENNTDSLYFKFSEYGNKYLNYQKDIMFAKEEENYKYDKSGGCFASSSDINYDFCKKLKYKNISYSEYYDYNDYSDYYIQSYSKLKYYYINEDQKKSCKKLLTFSIESNNSKKILYDRWLATIVISCLICIFMIGLIIFGFLLCKEPNYSNISVKTIY